MAEARSLYYFPHDPAAWLARTATLSPLARAAYADLRSAAWLAQQSRGAAPCTLPDDDAQLARLARLERGEWKKVRTEVRALLTLQDGALVDAELLTVWTAQHAAYERRAAAGAQGGTATREKRQKDSNAGSNATRGATSNGAGNAGSGGAAIGQQSELEEGIQQALKGHAVSPSAPGGALAPVGAAPRATVATGTNGSNGTNGHTPRPAVRSALAEQQAARDDRERRYFALLTAGADAWMASHREETKAIGFAQRTLLGIRKTGELAPHEVRILRDAVVEAIRDQQGWPSSDDWDGSSTLTPQVSLGATP